MLFFSTLYLKRDFSGGIGCCFQFQEHQIFKLLKVKRPIITVTSVWNTGKTGDMYSPKDLKDQLSKVLNLQV